MENFLKGLVFFNNAKDFQKHFEVFETLQRMQRLIQKF